MPATLSPVFPYWQLAVHIVRAYFLAVRRKKTVVARKARAFMSCCGRPVDNVLGNFHLGVITVFHIFQCDTYISAATGYTCGYSFCIRHNRSLPDVDIFRIITDIFIGGAFGSRVLILICERSSIGAISAGIWTPKYSDGYQHNHCNRYCPYASLRKASSERAYMRFIPSKKGSVFCVEPSLVFPVLSIAWLPA